MDNFFKIDLPKWPQMIVTGENISESKAKEILFRTDSFFIDINPGAMEDKFIEEYKRVSCLNRLDASDPDYFKNKDIINNALGHIYLEYLSNNYAYSRFIYGPHGWCNPNGTMFYEDNIGKWPSVEDVYKEWCIIYKEFPFLNLNVTIMSGEECEDGKRPLLNIKICDNGVIMEEPNLEVHKEIDKRPLAKKFSALSMYNSKFGVPKNWYTEKALKIREMLYALGFVK